MVLKRTSQIRILARSDKYPAFVLLDSSFHLGQNCFVGEWSAHDAIWILAPSKRLKVGLHFQTEWDWFTCVRLVLFYVNHRGNEEVRNRNRVRVGWVESLADMNRANGRTPATVLELHASRNVHADQSFAVEQVQWSIEHFDREIGDAQSVLIRPPADAVNNGNV